MNTKVLVLLASFSIFSWNVSAGVNEWMAEWSHYGLGKSCDNLASSALPKKNCDSHTSSIASIYQFKVDATEGSYLAVLGSERLENNQCAKKSLDSTLKKDNDFFQDIFPKIRSLATFKARWINIVDEIALLHRQTQSSGSIRLTAEQLKVKKEELKQRRAEYKRLGAAVGAIMSSIPLIEIQSVRETVNKQVNEMIEPAIQIRNKNKNPNEVIGHFDEGKFRVRMISAMKSGSRDIREDNIILEKGIKDGGVSYDGNLRESLAQEVELREAFQSKNPKIAKKIKPAMCEVDKKYGSGAKARDNLLMAGSIGLTAASMGIGGVIRAAGTAGVTFFSATRIAAVRGLVSMRAANIMAYTAVGMDGIVGALEIEKACFSKQNVKVESKAMCEAVNLKNLEYDNCAVAASLTALGVVLGSSIGQKIGSKLIRPLVHSKRSSDFLKSDTGKLLSKKLNEKEKKVFGKTLSKMSQKQFDEYVESFKGLDPADKENVPYLLRQAIKTSGNSAINPKTLMQINESFNVEMVIKAKFDGLDDLVDSQRLESYEERLQDTKRYLQEKVGVETEIREIKIPDSAGNMTPRKLICTNSAPKFGLLGRYLASKGKKANFVCLLHVGEADEALYLSQSGNVLLSPGSFEDSLVRRGHSLLHELVHDNHMKQLLSGKIKSTTSVSPLTLGPDGYKWGVGPYSKVSPDEVKAQLVSAELQIKQLKSGTLNPRVDKSLIEPEWKRAEEMARKSSQMHSHFLDKLKRSKNLISSGFNNVSMRQLVDDVNGKEVALDRYFFEDSVVGQLVVTIRRDPNLPVPSQDDPAVVNEIINAIRLEIPNFDRTHNRYLELLQELRSISN